MKKTYITPAIEQEEVVIEAGIAVSATIFINNSIQGDNTPEDWEEGNTNWW